MSNFIYVGDAAEQGDADAQYTFGLMHERGINNIPKDNRKAALWYKKAAEQGHKNAQYKMGVMHYIGSGVEENEETSFEWHLKAAQQGHVEAQYQVGYCYKNGVGTSTDMRQSFEWYRKAAEQGNVDAQYSLGILYGSGPDCSPEIFSELYLSYHKEGNVDGQLSLALTYAQSLSVPLDYVQAYAWLSLACKYCEAHMRELYTRHRDKVIEKMAPQQFLEAQSLLSQMSRKYIQKDS